MNISIILAAGEGSRMRSDIPKVLHKICGNHILKYVVDASKNAGIEKNFCIIGHGADRVKESMNDSSIEYREQPTEEGSPYGTGYAVMQAEEDIPENSTVLILYGDTPLIREETIEDLLEYHKENKNSGTVLTAYVENPTDYGRIIRDENNEVLKIVEQKDGTEEELKVKEINSGIYTFDGKLLKDALKKITNDNAQNEYYITDVIQILKDEGEKVGAYVMEDSIEIHGINSKAQLAFCEKIMRERINEGLMDKGVIMMNPENTYISNTVEIGIDTLIYPGVIIEGDSKIGRDCIIGANSRIVDSKIEDGVEIQSSTILESTIGENSTVGPYAYLRPKSKIGKNVKIGDFVEVKNANIGDNTKASHLTYIGDADVGENVNLGCGVVFVNYDGENKFRSKVGNNSFIGSNSNLVAPVIVEDWAYIAAGSTITENVEESSLSIARAKQVNKKNWVVEKGLRKDK